MDPRREFAETIVCNELDDFSEIMFFNRGTVDIGFEINRKRKFVLRKQKSIVIADHGCTFNHKSCFIYKAKTVCEGFSIKKLAWLKVLESNKLLSDQLKKSIVTNYFYGTKIKIMKEKRKEILRLKSRSDIQAILIVTDKEDGQDMKHLNANFSDAAGQAK